MNTLVVNRREMGVSNDKVRNTIMPDELRSKILDRIVEKNKLGNSVELVMSVFKDGKFVREFSFDANGNSSEGGEKLQDGEYLLVGVEPKKVKYIVKDVASALVIRGESGCASAVYINKDNLSAVVQSFPGVPVVAGSNDITDVKAVTSNICDINKFGGDKEERKIFRRRSFESVMDFYLAGGDVNIALKTGKETRMTPLWWAMERSRKPSWLIFGFIPDAPALAVMYSMPNCGKTYIALDIALTLASGRPEWFGLKAQSGPTLYICGEGNDGFFTRIKCWLQEYGEFDLSKIKFVYEKKLFSFDVEKDYAEFVRSLEERCVEERPRLIIIDTLNLYMSNDENSTEEMSTMLKTLKTFCNKYECTILILHHCGNQDVARERGSSTLRGCVDVAIRVSKKDGVIKIEQVKNRNAEIMKPLYAVLEKHAVTSFLENEEDAEPVVDCIVRQVDAPQNAEFTKGESFLVDFCVDRYARSLPWAEFSRGELLEYGKMVLADDSVPATVQLNPNQKGKILNALLRDGVLEEIEDVTVEGGNIMKGKHYERYKIVSERMIKVIQSAIVDNARGVTTYSDEDDE